jgi:hypothetical protein
MRRRMPQCRAALPLTGRRQVTGQCVPGGRSPRGSRPVLGVPDKAPNPRNSYRTSDRYCEVPPVRPMIMPRRQCVLHAEAGDMQRDVATDSSEVATELPSPSLMPPNDDFQRIAIAAATHCGLISQDVGLNTSLRLALAGQENVIAADRSSRLSEFLRTLSAGLSELGHPGALAFASCIQTLGPALDLLPALRDFRAFLSRAWGIDTVYPETANQSSWIPRTPHGQCGVSSAWLTVVLHRQYSLPSTFCQGSLIFNDQRAESVLDHCWLELSGSAGEELILDLTCDQAQGFDRPIVLHAKTHLDRQRVSYIPYDRLNISDLPDSPVWTRYEALRRNLGWPSPAPS